MITSCFASISSSHLKEKLQRSQGSWGNEYTCRFFMQHAITSFFSSKMFPAIILYSDGRLSMVLVSITGYCCFHWTANINLPFCKLNIMRFPAHLLLRNQRQVLIWRFLLRGNISETSSTLETDSQKMQCLIHQQKLPQLFCNCWLKS